MQDAVKPSTHKGRILIKEKNVKMYKPDGTVHRTLNIHEGLRVYESGSDNQNGTYNVGNGYFVKAGPHAMYYLGHVYSKDRFMYVYNLKGQVYKKFIPKQTARVYSVTNGKYQVGGGYYVIPAGNIQLEN